MKNKIRDFEKQAKLLEPNTRMRYSLRKKVIEYSEDFLKHIATSPAYQTPLTQNAAISQVPITENPEDLNYILKLLKDNVDTPGLNPASGGYIGLIPGGGIYTSALGDYLVDITNRASAIYFLAPGAVRIENLLLRWIADLIGFPKTASGNLTSGGSIATLIAIVTARDAKQLKAHEFSKAVIYLTDQTHHCAIKAIRIAGLNDAIRRYIPLDNEFRMETTALENQIQADLQAGLKPFLIIASAGTTNTGAIDPLPTISAISEKYQLWLHVDAAYGGFFMLTEAGKKLLHGLETADSVVLDPHKGLFLPYGTGIVLVKDRKFLLESHHYQATYLQDMEDNLDELSPADLSPELTRPFRGLRLWLPLMLHGMAPFRAALEEKLLLTQYFYEKILAINGFEVACTPQLSIVTFRYVPRQMEPNLFNKKLLELTYQDGRVFLSSTLLNGQFYLRLACLSFRTHLKTIDLTLKILREQIKNILVKEPY